MKRWSLVLALATSCTTFSDLETQHPFVSSCDEGFERNEAGECVLVANNVVNNDSNTPNNTPNNQPNNVNNPNLRPNNFPCEQPGPGECCGTPDGEEYCCTDDGTCCYFDPSECNLDPPNNNQVPWFHEYVLVIADFDPQQCEDINGDGPDIYGVQLFVGDEVAQPYLVDLQPGTNAQPDDGLVEAVLSQQLDEPLDTDMCPQTEWFSLGCGGAVAVGFDGIGDPASQSVLTVLESAPQCDQFEDRYTIYLCPMDQWNDSAICEQVGESIEGSIQVELPF